ncbi:VOC family protein [Planococcus sp. CP5-4]|uniref:VOC family protein n=1 Tax=unclassified Planococcus (in: firmicutes) TaxID=2662419 RepID=UPI001C23110D|nr:MULTISPECIES: VOC family protein [unclassified Planococcus (in: firmicutes)]MBU9672366.1 VOC family protein [Planococcus sp. CP5-4_YE]MBV0909417.1 VOC family protein [Planococcus sp. CP5-4_UN]MBW6064146.1 VOC family protein [Planococcus sp. CP5-4]
MTVNVYMIFNGNCEEAVAYYAKVFSTEPNGLSRFGDMPSEPGQEMPEEMKNRIMHASLDIHGSVVMFSDAMSDVPISIGKNINVTVISDDLNKMTEEFKQLAQDGTVQMELQETFWSLGYGIVEDKFGIIWMFSHDDFRQ